MKGDSEASRIGEVVGGKYRIVRLLAKGGMGVVYEAQHTVVRRRFAIKFLRRDLSERRDILTRFQHEAEAAGALENHNVMAAIDFGISDDGAPYIVMEYLVGESLASLLEREGRMPVSRAADLIAQAGRGVAAAHEIGIVHRDLKPHNLFVCRREDGTDLLKVLDFGVAKLQAIDEASAATRTGMVLGTAAYMSPEQARGDKTVDNKTDVYALGAILYELVSQRRPHPGDSQNAILHHISTQPPVPLESVQPDLPPEFADVVKRAIASDPATRPASADALVQALAPFARREVWPVTREESGPTRAEMTSTVLAERHARPTPSASRIVAATADDRPPAAPTPSLGGSATPTLRTRSRAAMVMGLGVAVAVVAIAVTAGLKSRGGDALARSREKTPAKFADGRRDAEPNGTGAVLSVGTLAPEGAGGANAKPAAHEMTETDEHTLASERPSRHGAARRLATNAANGDAQATPPANLRQASEHRPAPTFDSDNPYR
jgi:serine/threonine protein kinase